MAKKLYGTDPDQVPTNADLGTMAYQDSQSVRVQTIRADTAVGAGVDINDDLGDHRFVVADKNHGLVLDYVSALPAQAGLFTSSTALTQSAYGDLNIKARTDYGGNYGIGFFTARSNNDVDLRMGINSTGTRTYVYGDNATDFHVKRDLIDAKSSFSNPTVNLFTVASGNNNNAVIAKVRVLQCGFVGASPAVGNEHHGMITLWNNASAQKYQSPTNTMSIVLSNGTTNVGTISYSGSNGDTSRTLQYTTNRATNYDNYYITWELYCTDGSNFTITY